MGDIVKFPITPKINLTDAIIPVKDVLLGADRADLQETIVIGWRANPTPGEDQFYFASSEADGGNVLWLLELAKKRLLEAGDRDSTELEI